MTTLWVCGSVKPFITIRVARSLHCFSFDLLVGGEDQRYREPIPQTRSSSLLPLFALLN